MGRNGKHERSERSERAVRRGGGREERCDDRKPPVGTNGDAATSVRSEATEGVWGIPPPMDKRSGSSPAGTREKPGRWPGLRGPRQNQTLVYSILLSYKCFLTFLGVSVDTLVEHRWHFCAKIVAIVQPVKVPESLFSVPIYPGFVLTPRSPVRSELIIYPWFIILTPEQYLTFLGCGGLPFLQGVILLCLHTIISIKSDHVTGDGLYSFQFHKQIQILK